MNEFEKSVDTLGGIQLTLEPSLDQPKSSPLQKESEAVNMGENILTEEEQQAVCAFASQIDLSKTEQILQYGAGTQKKMADFSEEALKNVRTQDLGSVGKLISDVVVELKDFDSEEEKGIFGFFRKQRNRIEALKAQYDKTEVNVNKITEALEKYQIQLLKDSAALDKMYQLNLNYYKELTMYIMAGKMKLQDVRDTQLVQLEEKARKSGLAEDAQAVRDLDNMCIRFEKKLHDLELTRTICMQTAPQIRLVQNNDTTMVEKIQTTLLNTIPLWKSQMVLALGIAHSNAAVKSQTAVTDLTNDLLRKNAETLHTATIKTAVENERGIVDIETLKNTNAQLIQTLDDMMKIQQEGKQKRQAAEAEIGRIEQELKDKLLEIRG